MQSKSLLIAIAAFAVTTTGVNAYSGSKILNRANLTEEQRTAIVQAQELRAEGDVEGARDLLVEAGIDEQALRAMHRARYEAHNEMRQALAAGDYAAFKEAVADTPLADLITSEEDFAQFREAHELRRSGEAEEAEALFESLGIEHPPHKSGKRHGKSHVFSQLSDEQREAFLVAKQANDRATMHAILDEAGVSLPPHR